jgi:hypothetical protein
MNATRLREIIDLILNRENEYNVQSALSELHIRVCVGQFTRAARQKSHVNQYDWCAIFSKPPEYGPMTGFDRTLSHLVRIKHALLGATASD